jgi:hypothetical protein
LKSFVARKCATCGGEMIQKNRPRLFVAGVLMLASIALTPFVPYFWAPGVLLALTGAYLLSWATLGKGAWCRACKKFSVL